MKRRFLFEADDDNAADAGGTPDAGATADAGTTDNGTPDDTSGDTTNNDDTNPDDDGIEDPGNGDEDFSIDSTPDDNFGDDANTDDNNNDDNSGGDGYSSDSDEPEVSADSLKAKDAQLFDDLEPAQQEIKLKELKEQYLNLYQVCDGVIDKINSLSKDYEDINEQLKKVTNVLFTTKKMIADYLLHIFDSKSYIENDIQYNNYLAILNSVKNIIKEYKNGYKDTNTTS